jgi:putative transposase
VRALQAKGVSEQRACKIVGCSRNTVRYRVRRLVDSAILSPLRELAAKHRRFGYRKLGILLRRDGIIVNHKKLYRIYKEAALGVPRRRKRHVRYERGLSTLIPVTAANQRWSIDFLSDSLISGRRIRVLPIVDDFTREGLTLEVDFSLPAQRVVRALDDVAAVRGYPKVLRSDNGPEFVSHSLLRWAAEHNVRLHFIEPGKPTQNANIESLNARIRDEFLNEHAFLTLRDARREAALWLDHYNTIRPHGSLGYLTPLEFAQVTSQNTAHLPAA